MSANDEDDEAPPPGLWVTDDTPAIDAYGLPRALTIAQAAEILGTAHITAYRMVRLGKLHGERKANGTWELAREDVLAKAGPDRVAAWATVTQRDLRVRVSLLERGRDDDGNQLIRWIDHAMRLERRIKALEAHLGLAGTPSPAPKPPV